MARRRPCRGRQILIIIILARCELIPTIYPWANYLFLTLLYLAGMFCTHYNTCCYDVFPFTRAPSPRGRSRVLTEQDLVQRSTTMLKLFFNSNDSTLGAFLHLLWKLIMPLW